MNWNKIEDLHKNESGCYLFWYKSEGFFFIGLSSHNSMRFCVNDFENS